MHDDQLREQLTRWAEPLQAARPPSFVALRRRARRRTASRAAASGLAVLGTAAVIAVAVYPRPGPAPVRTQATSAVPRYAVVLQHRTGGQPASVVDMATGKVVGGIAAPVPRSDFEWVAAAADERTFVLADQTQALLYQFYVLHLAADGKPGRLTPVGGRPLRNAQIYGMAVTADGGKLAVAWQNYPTGPVTGRISVITLATRATRTWTSAQGSASTLSWAGQRTLAFDWQDSSNQAQSGLRLLDTAAAGTSPLASRLLVPASTREARLTSPDAPLLTQDGSTLFATMSKGTRSTIVRFSARTGKFQAVLIHPVPAGPQYCGVLWSDPRGQHVIIQCGTTQASIEGTHYTRIHLPRVLPASPVGWANTFAW